MPSRAWPLIGEKIYLLWSEAVTNTEAILLQAAPYMKTVGGKLLSISQSVAVGLLQFVGSIVIAGFLYSPGPRIVEYMRVVLRRVLGHESQQMLQLVGNTIRNVARGVVGIALLQALLAGVGFVVAGIPAAGLFTFLALLLGIIQIGPSILIIPIVVWSWMKMEPSSALMFTAYMVPVSLIDNVLQTGDHGTRLVHADAGDPGGCHRRHDSLWHQRPVRRPYRSGSALGPDPGMDG